MDFCIMLFCELVLLVLCPELAHVPENAEFSCEDFWSFMISPFSHQSISHSLGPS